MRNFFTLLIFFFFTSISVNAQISCLWTGAAENGLWADAVNWDQGEVPSSNDTAYFEDVGPLTVYLGETGNYTDSVAALYISGDSNIHFQSFDINSSCVLGVLEYFELSSASSIHLLSESIEAVHLWITGLAEVYGLVQIDRGSSFGPYFDGTNAPIIYFKPGSKFIAGENLTSVTAFNDFPETVWFEDESTYEHRGGPSPLGGVGNVVSFSQYSNYNIYTTVASNILFSGKTYGNINVYSAVDLTIASNATVFSVFTFNNLTAVNAGIAFSGTMNDAVVITGEFIDAQGGVINLTCGQSFSFTNTNTPVYLKGTNDIHFAMLGDANFVFVESDVELILENTISVQSIPGGTAYFIIKGVIDCQTHQIIPSDAYLTLQAGSLLKTANTTGVLGSVTNILFEPEASIEYYGPDDGQNAGLPPYCYLQEIVVSKQSGSVILNTTTETSFLVLNSGFFDISDQTLRITKGINYNGGDLLTNPDASRLEFIEVDGTTANIDLKTPLSLSDLSLSLTGNVILTEGGTLTVKDSLELFSGRLDIQNSNLYLGETIYINPLLSTSGYIIAEGSGFVKKIFSNTAVSEMHIPIGTANYFSGLILIPNITSEISVNCFEHVYSEGIGGTQYTEDMLDMTWNILPADLSVQTEIQIYWEPGTLLELPGFEYADAFISVYNNTDSVWVNEPSLSSSVSAATLPFVGISRETDQYGFFAMTSSLINNSPSAGDQAFSLPERSPNGTLVGNLIARDPDAGQTLSFYVQDNHSNPDAFEFLPDGTVTVKNQEFLNHAFNPLFEYTVDVCDDGDPLLCSSFGLLIKLDPILGEVQISNYLSPNNDSYNDTWNIRGAEIIPIDVFVYDRSGQLIYKAEDYQNTWDGTLNGKKLPEGVYYYLVRTGREEYKGSLTLVR